jgi:hypothetical protein
MRSSTRQILALAVLLPIACLSASAPGASPNEKLVTVRMTYSQSDPKVPIGVATPDPDPVYVSRGKKQIVHWVLSPPELGTLKVTMDEPDQKPFRVAPVNHGKDTHSGPAEAGTNGEKYKYSLTVHVDSLNREFVLDPIIITTP